MAAAPWLGRLGLWKCTPPPWLRCMAQTRYDSAARNVEACTGESSGTVTVNAETTYYDLGGRGFLLIDARGGIGGTGGKVVAGVRSLPMRYGGWAFTHAPSLCSCVGSGAAGMNGKDASAATERACDGGTYAREVPGAAASCPHACAIVVLAVLSPAGARRRRRYVGCVVCRSRMVGLTRDCIA